jgi:hypothetical protein
MTKERRKQLKDSIKGWQEYTDREHFLPAKNTGQRAVNSLKLELEHGEPFCVCHLMKLKECPRQIQNKGYR